MSALFPMALSRFGKHALIDPGRTFFCDEVDSSTPTGWDSIAQGALTLGWITGNEIQPQRATP